MDLSKKLSALFGQRGNREREVVFVEEIEKIRMIIEGDDPDNWSTAKPLSIEHPLSDNCMEIKIGDHRLRLIGKFSPGQGPESIQIVTRKQIKKGNLLEMNEGLLVGVPFPRDIVTEDGRIFYNSQILDGLSSTREEKYERAQNIKLLRKILPRHVQFLGVNRSW